MDRLQKINSYQRIIRERCRELIELSNSFGHIGQDATAEILSNIAVDIKHCATESEREYCGIATDDLKRSQESVAGVLKAILNAGESKEVENA